MKAFLIRFLIFILPFTVFLYPFDILISNGLKQSTFSDGEIETWYDIYEGNIDSENLICGSSRAWKHLDLFTLDKKTHTTFYNLGMDAHNFYLQNLRFQELLKYNPKLKVILYSLDMATLEKRPDLYNKNQFLPFLNYSSDAMSFKKQYFYNSMHLNTKGSQIFTSKLADDLIKYKLLK